MDLRHLRYFVKVVELRSITAAAEALFIAQPSLSQHMANLESELGVALLERSVQGTRPTAMGELLYRHAKGILRQVDDARSAIRSGSEAPAGRVAIGLPTSTSRVLAAPLLARLQEHYPLIELELVEASSGDLAGQVAVDRLALAVTMDAREDARLRIERLLEEELFVVVGADRRTPKALGLHALAAMPLLLPTHPNSVRVAVERLLQPHGLRCQLVAETSAVEILLLAVERGLGATILPMSAFTLAEQMHRVRGVPISGRPLTREVSLSVSVSAARSPAVQCVRESLLQTVHDEVAQGRWPGVRRFGTATRARRGGTARTE
ncbi:LysR family nitrogen assimilation transcriptional regulator [Variovorax sp. TBS-050B]|uniref:LysR substrate-binding domain-containing protein n=1 Tax=Variovorax sp. TBS-050B TaxID=2940551 RepID=UPI0024771419|nr:LysR substrate-binding domain-containing protein [Variovorax sp. TBS-050B]MDH6594129.1 LysR family nitrogen assimilation transcriptional regulator [Variovorax sp. TBS-050B]